MWVPWEPWDLWLVPEVRGVFVGTKSVNREVCANCLASVRAAVWCCMPSKPGCVHQTSLRAVYIAI